MTQNDKLSLLIQQRLKRYAARTDQELVNAAKEILQEIVLFGLSRSGFFKSAAFHGGTALRIFYQLDRFSEDLDFALIAADPKFNFGSFMRPLKEECRSWGLEVEVVDRSQASSAVKKAFVKNNSLGAELTLKVPLAREQKLLVKIELDVNPPQGAKIESKLADFPADHYVVCHDLPTLFAGKLHSILCRPYVKGRDWYDLAFYFSRRIAPNLIYLRYALEQMGPHQSGLPKTLSIDWLCTLLTKRFAEVDFVSLRKDVSPFINNESATALWSDQFFRDKMELWRKGTPAGF